jgi:hypothetical protein
MPRPPATPRRRAPAALCLLPLLSLWAQAQSPDALIPSASTHVLLIGIDDYEQVPGFKSLDGPGNDIDLIANTLSERFGIPRSRMTFARNAEATHSKLQDAFAKLAEQVLPGDFVYVHFSGHGSTAVDPADPSGFDQTWVPHGARSGKAKGPDDHDIRDKAISAWLRPIYAKTNRLVFVSDSCHSATVTRGTSKTRTRGVRSAPPDQRPQTLEPIRIERPGEAPGIKIGAVEDTDSASEFDPDSSAAGCSSRKNCYGIFTWFWAKALSEVRPGQTWFDLFLRASTLSRSAVHNGSSLRPQFSGPRGQAVADDTFSAPRPTLPVISVDPERRSLTLGAGLLEGLTKGSRYILPSRTAPGGDAELVVTSVGFFSAQGLVVRGAFEVGDPVTEFRHAHEGHPVRVALQWDAPSSPTDAWATALTARLGELAGVETTQDASSADLILQLGWQHTLGFSCQLTRVEGVPPPTHSSTPSPTASSSPVSKSPLHAWRLVKRDGEPILGGCGQDLSDGAHLPPSLSKHLTDFARARAFERLKAPAADWPLQVFAVHLTPSDRCGGNCLHLSHDLSRQRPYEIAATYLLPHARLRLTSGDALAFKVAPKGEAAYTDADWHFYIAHISPEPGRLTLIFPMAEANDGEARLRADGPAPTDLFAFNSKVFTQTGRHLVKALITSEPLSLGLIDITSYPGAAPIGTKGVREPDMHPPYHDTDEAPDAAWHTVELEIEVSPSTQAAR